MASSKPPIEPLPPGAGRDPRPIVRRPAAGLPGGVIALIAAVLALLLFVVLNSHRRHTVVGTANRDGVSAFPAPPPLAIPPEAVPVVQTAPVVQERPLPPADFRPAMPARFNTAASLASPTIVPVQPPNAEPQTTHPDGQALVLDTGTGDGGTASSNGSSATQGNQSGGASTGDDAPVRTTVIRNRTTIMPTGTVIPAVLETPIDSTRPGLIRAIVSEDARGFDGRDVLIPKGSRLIGEYQSDVRSGQNRVLVTWTRLIRPDGVAIRIGSPAADALGGAGIPGRVNSFFFQRFASAVLQSALTIGVNLASRPGNGSVIVGLPSTGTGTIGQDLIPGSDLKPKIKVRQGAVLDVFVAHDLDFSGTAYRSQDGQR